VLFWREPQHRLESLCHQEISERRSTYFAM
jgi:hypothetical protein